jgi:hypothetical protein
VRSRRRNAESLCSQWGTNRMLTSEQFDPGRTRLWNELVNLHDTWDEYRVLFAESAGRIEMLNACAGWFFGRTQRLLMRDVILGLSRMTDSPRTAGRSNLIIDYLLKDPALAQYPHVRADLAAAITAAREAAKPFKIHRNKYIAHLDHDTAVAADETLFPGLRRDDITAAIGLLERAYNIHGSAVRGVTAFFDVRPLGGAAAVVRIMEQSERWTRMKGILDERARAKESPGGAA